MKQEEFQTGVINVMFGHFKKREQERINDEYQQEFPDEEIEFNDLIYIPIQEVKACVLKKYWDEYRHYAEINRKYHKENRYFFQGVGK